MARSSRSSSSSSGNRLISIISAFLVFVVLAGSVVAVFTLPQLYWVRDRICKVTHFKTFCQQVLDIQTVQVGLDTPMYVGLSDGNFAFDQYDTDSQYKQKAMTDYKAGNIDAAIQDWTQAIDTTTDDAEAMIYLENERVAASHQRYVTIIVATTLSISDVTNDRKTSLSVGRDDLRGVYLAQKDFNAKSLTLKVRIVLANLGVKDQDHLEQAIPPVLNLIQRLADTDNTIIGVIGFPFSAAAKLAIPTLTAENIPLISPSASSIELSSLYFFRVAPPDSEQGQDAAQFASQVLNAQHVLVLSDPTNSYSKSLGTSFANGFRKINANEVADTRPFTLHNLNSLDAPMQPILSQNPPINMVFVAGYADDVDNVKTWLANHNTTAIVMGGDAAYELGGYPQGQNYKNIFFSAFTYPDTWSLLCPNHSDCASLEPPMLNPDKYKQTFDPNNQHPGEYSYSRSGPHVFLSYDATQAFLEAAMSALPAANGNSIPRQAIRDALQHDAPFQGASGQISFSGSNPVDKTVVMLCVDSEHRTHLIHVYGKFAPGAKDFQDATSVCL